MKNSKLSVINTKLNSLDRLDNKNVYYLIKQFRYYSFKNNVDEVDKIKDSFKILYNFNSMDIYYLCRKYENLRDRRYRLKKRIDDMINYSLIFDKRLVFLTFTFNDDFIDKNYDWNRFIKKYMKDNNVLDYLFNIDYGKLNGRLHYHSIVMIDSDLDYSLWRFGALNGIQIRIFNSSDLASYIDKLTNHSFKNDLSDKVVYKRFAKDKNIYVDFK